MIPVNALATLLAATDSAPGAGRGGATVVFVVVVLAIVGFIGSVVAYTVRRDRQLSDDRAHALDQTPDADDAP
ncbi:hypothetical protein [Euzebya tangerina]|uniref:hypothetical protein n=1 Tax=Euzebya tangerina TaxID=591198 RepID=UPI000E31154F|nr:hypothetical protein [Euzebya tangerina]